MGEAREHRRESGAAAEQLAAEYFEARGYKVLERNHKTRLGEVDLIVEKGPAVVFVEVRFRRTVVFGDPVETVVRRKRTRVLLAAMQYAQEQGLMNRDLRFDVVSVSEWRGQPRLQHYENAFEADLPPQAVPAFL
jgi:putative endonuclease